MDNLIKNNQFYNEQSNIYSRKRYEGSTDTFIKFFFKKRRRLLIEWMSGILTGNGQRLLEIGCADGIITRSIEESFPDKFKEIIGLDIANDMVQTANKLNAKKHIKYILRDNLSQDDKFQIILGVGVIDPGKLRQELEYAFSYLEPRGYYFCTLTSKRSLNLRFRPPESSEEYRKNYRTFREYENILSEKFEILKSEPYGLLIPMIWKLPNCARWLQPIAEVTLKYLIPDLFHEKIYLLQKK